MKRSLLIPVGQECAKNLPPSPRQLPSVKSVETLMTLGNKVPEVKTKTSTFEERDEALPLSPESTKIDTSSSTAVFETFLGVVENDFVEKKLIEAEFLPTEKILTRDDLGNVVCHFIKIRDKLGHAAYVELDTTSDDGIGFISVSPNDTILHHSHEASVIPYSMKIGTFEANSDLYGVGFECDNSICVMSRKDPSLEPSETVFSFSESAGQDMGIIENHPIPFPIVKMTEILANPQAVARSIAISHARMRNVAFSSCMRDVECMKENIKELEKEIEMFDKTACEVSTCLKESIEHLEKWHEGYEKRGIRCPEDTKNLSSIRFNLQKRNDLQLDHIALCHSMKERSAKIKALTEEIRELNEYSTTLFSNLSKVFVE